MKRTVQSHSFNFFWELLLLSMCDPSPHAWPKSPTVSHFCLCTKCLLFEFNQSSCSFIFFQSVSLSFNWPYFFMEKLSLQSQINMQTRKDVWDLETKSPKFLFLLDFKGLNVLVHKEFERSELICVFIVNY